MIVEQIYKSADKYANGVERKASKEIVKQAFIDGYHEGFKDCAKSRLNVTTISDCPIKNEVKLEYARTIIKDLLFNSDEYARQRAIDFLMENGQK